MVWICVYSLDLLYSVNSYKTSGFPPFEDFSIVDQATLCLEDCYHGVHSIYPVTFSTAHFCLVHCQVHGELINFKFIPPPPPLKLQWVHYLPTDSIRCSQSVALKSNGFKPFEFEPNGFNPLLSIHCPSIHCLETKWFESKWFEPKRFESIGANGLSPLLWISMIWIHSLRHHPCTVTIASVWIHFDFSFNPFAVSHFCSEKAVRHQIPNRNQSRVRNQNLNRNRIPNRDRLHSPDPMRCPMTMPKRRSFRIRCHWNQRAQWMP